MSLAIASCFGDIEKCRDALNSGTNVDYFVCGDGATMLHGASSYGHLDIIELLLLNNANINMQDSTGWTALHCACYKGQLTVVKLLLEHGANFELQTTTGQTAFDVAPTKEIKDYIIAYQTDFDIKEPSGC